MLTALLGILQTLGIFWKGMLSIFIVVVAIMGIVYVLNKVFRK